MEYIQWEVKVVVNNNIIEEMEALNYPDYCISYENEKDTIITLKISKFLQVMWSTGWSKVSVHLIITMKSLGAQRLFDHPVLRGLSNFLKSKNKPDWKFVTPWLYLPYHTDVKFGKLEKSINTR
jgi:hypothetical protein